MSGTKIFTINGNNYTTANIGVLQVIDFSAFISGLKVEKDGAKIPVLDYFKTIKTDDTGKTSIGILDIFSLILQYTGDEENALRLISFALTPFEGKWNKRNQKILIDDLKEDGLGLDQVQEVFSDFFERNPAYLKPLKQWLESFMGVIKSLSVKPEAETPMPLDLNEG